MDYYQILNVTKNASQEEIKKAYRKMASVTHPDKGGSVTSFQKVEQAYRILSDHNTRQQYDHINNQSFKDIPLNDNFQDFFDFIRTHRTHQTFRTQVSLSLEEVYYGKTSLIKIQTTHKEHVIQVEIPRGVRHNQHIKVENIIYNSTLVIEIQITKHLKFDIRNNDLVANYPISVLDLISGNDNLTFTTITNKQIPLSIFPLTQPFTEIKIPQEGLPIYNSNLFGDQILLLKPFIPANISKEVIDYIKRHKND